MKKILQPDVIKNLSELVANLADKEFNDKSRLLTLREELKSVQSSLTNLLKLVEKGIDVDDIGERLLALNAQKSDLIKQIDKEEIKKPLISKEGVEFWLTKFVTNGTEDDEAYSQRIIDTLVNQVFVFDSDDGGRKIVITYNTSLSMSSTLTISDIRGVLNGSDIEGSPRPVESLDTQFAWQAFFFFKALMHAIKPNPITSLQPKKRPLTFVGGLLYAKAYSVSASSGSWPNRIRR